MLLNDLDKPSLEELAHHGVRGMHWGHRKASGGLGPIAKVRARDTQIKNDRKEAKTFRKELRANKNAIKTVNSSKTLSPQKKAAMIKNLTKKYEKTKLSYVKSAARSGSQRYTSAQMARITTATLASIGVGLVPVHLGVVGAAVANRKRLERERDNLLNP